MNRLGLLIQGSLCVHRASFRVSQRGRCSRNGFRAAAFITVVLSEGIRHLRKSRSYQTPNSERTDHSWSIRGFLRGGSGSEDTDPFPSRVVDDDGLLFGLAAAVALALDSASSSGHMQYSW